MRKIFIGMGSGRCGTLSLAMLLDLQKNSTVSHEVHPLMPYYENKLAFKAKIDILLNRKAPNVGDVASSYLGYVPLFIKTFPDIKMVCLKREKDSCVASFMRKTKGRNNFQYGKEPRTLFEITSPDYPSFYTKEEATELYYDDYYKLAKDLETAYPDNFKIFDMEYLNTFEGVNKILEFYDIDEKDRVCTVGLQMNQTEK